YPLPLVGFQDTGACSRRLEWTIHPLPWVGFQDTGACSRRLQLNDPPTAGRDSRLSRANLFSCWHPHTILVGAVLRMGHLNNRGSMAQARRASARPQARLALADIAVPCARPQL